MPSLFAASITVAPCWTSTSLPSTSTLSIVLSRLCYGRGVRAGPSPLRLAVRPADQAALVLDVVFEFLVEVLDEALDGQRRGIAQRADRATGDVVGNVVEQVE